MDMTPPDYVCSFCEDWCSGTCEGAREQRLREATTIRGAYVQISDHYEPAVLGAGCGVAPKPTESEMRCAYINGYVAHMRVQGVPEEFARQSAKAIDWELVKAERLSPEEMAHAEMEQWSAD